MSLTRRIASTLWLALALLVGQHAAAMHDLGHATDRLSQKKESQHRPSSCDKCFACAELSSAAGTSIPAIALPTAVHEAPYVTPEAGTACAPFLAFRSRAPPSLL